ncbi:MAG: outer membrane beta-barrel protein [Bacteroidota bacterium]
MLIIVFLSSKSNAQIHIGGKLIGLDSKVIPSSIAEHDGIDYQHLWNPSAGFGIIGQFEISNSVSVKTELLFIKKGFRRTIQSELLQIEGSTESALNYLELPILFEFNFGEGGFTFFINAGPSFAYWKGGIESGQIQFCNTLYEYNRHLSFNKSSHDENNPNFRHIATADRNRIDVLANLSLGVHWKNESGFGIFIESRISQGLINYSNVEKQHFETTSGLHRNISLSIVIKQAVNH